MIRQSSETPFSETPHFRDGEEKKCSGTSSHFPPLAGERFWWERSKPSPLARVMWASSRLAKVSVLRALTRTPSVCLTLNRRASGWHPRTPWYLCILSERSPIGFRGTPWLGLVKSGRGRDEQKSPLLPSPRLKPWGT